MSAWHTAHGIVARDLARARRQTGRLLGGIARPFMWLLLIGTGYGAIASLESGLSYPAYVFPGIVVMAALFGGTLTAVSTVYDREFGMLRLMLASPAGTGAVLGGRAAAATLVGMFQGGLVLAVGPLVLDAAPARYLFAAGALALVAGMSATLGLMVAARLRSVENFAGIINVVLFPLLFLSGALYPTGGMPPGFRAVARVNPVTSAVDLVRHALGQPAETSLAAAGAVVLGTTATAFLLAALLFDPEQRFTGARGAR
ncbi:MAG TPA: ABC transporter permease [Gemmatimonadales bacterium]|nr:ABC transporter permease [Gemmatimonadales bacterium]